MLLSLIYKLNTKVNMRYFLLSLLIFFMGCKSNTEKNKAIFRIGVNKDPTTIDPRRSFANDIGNIMLMLYDGLMRYDENHELSYSLAKHVEISDDKKEYIFTIRDAKWSDGSQITAYDFERSWKKILDKDFPSVYPHKFYMIENAEEAKNGKVSSDKIGIKALNDKTLYVKLNYPTPYFLKQLAYSIAFAVHKNDQYFENQPEKISFSGPFILEKWKRNDCMILRKNPYYWDKGSVKLRKIKINIIDNPNTLLNLFENEEIDFLGAIFSPIPFDAKQALNKKGTLQYSPSNGSIFLEFNSEKFPFTNKNIRIAFSLAMNREQIEKNVTYGHGKAAYTLVPSFYTIPSLGYEKTAKEYLAEGLKELNINKEELNVSYVFKDDEITEKIAQIFQQNWKENLGVIVNLEKQTWRNYIQNFTEKNYQLFQIRWTCDVTDPIFLLNIFRLKFGGSNQPRWQNKAFQALLDKSDKCFDENERIEILKKAEKLLLKECIIAPIIYDYSESLSNKRLKNIQHFESGYTDFRWAYLE